MASIIPPRFVPVTHFTTDPDDREGLASDQEWKEEIEEEIITISLARHLDTALLSQPPPSHAKVPPSSAGPPLSAGPSASSTGGAEAGPSTTASSSKKPPTPRHTWSLIGLNTPMPYLKVNNTVYKGKAMESVESEMILRMKKPRKEGKPVTEDDHWAAYQIPLLASEHTLYFTPQQLAPESGGDQATKSARGPLQRPKGPRMRSKPNLGDALSNRGGSKPLSRGRGRGRGRGSRGGGRGGRGGRRVKGQSPAERYLDVKEEEDEAHHSGDEHSDDWEAFDDDGDSDLEGDVQLREGERRSSRPRRSRTSLVPDYAVYGDIFEDQPPAPQPMEIDPALLEVFEGAQTGGSTGLGTEAGLQAMPGFGEDSD